MGLTKPTRTADAPFEEIPSPQRQEAANEARLLLENGQPIFADLAEAIREIDGEDAIRVDDAIDDVEDGDSIDSVELPWGCLRRWLLQ